MLKKKLGLEAIEGDWNEEYIYDYYKIPSTLIIPEGCREIGCSAFGGCDWLKKVIIPKSVVDINYIAFCGCRRATIILKKPLSEFMFIGPTAFDDVRNVKEEIRN